MLHLLLACAPTPVDDLASLAPSKNTAVLGWIDPGDQDAWLELGVSIDGGAARIWRQNVPADGRIVGLVPFEKTLTVTVRDGGQPAGEPLELTDTVTAGVQQFGDIRLSWQVGRGLSAPNPAVDRHPGLPVGWLEASAPDAAPLVIGLDEAQASSGWPIAAGTTPKRSLGGLVAEGGGVRVRGFVSFEDKKVSEIDLLLSGEACTRLGAELTALYGAPGPRWEGGRTTVLMRQASTTCSVAFDLRRYASAGARAVVSKPAPPSPALAARPGPPEGWITPTRADGAPLTVGMSEAEARNSWDIAEAGAHHLYALGGVQTGSGYVNLQDGAVKEVQLEFSDETCVATQAKLEAAYGVGTPSLASMWLWNADKVRVQLSPLGSRCFVWWKQAT